jgi:MFS family permease
MHFVKPYFVVPQPPPPPAGTSAFSALSGISSTTDASDASTQPAPVPTAKPGKLKRSAQLDLLTIRISLLIEMSVYTLLALNLSPTGFVIASMCVTLASATGPTANSLALSLLPNSREAGRLFGALSVIHALGATLLSPLLFGTLFAYTVGWYAPTVFALAACFGLLTQLCFAFVRLPKAQEGQVTAERGRSRSVKRVKSSHTVRA